MRARVAGLMLLAVTASAIAQGPVVKPEWAAAHDLKVRKGKETDWEKALKVGVELFKDPAVDSVVGYTRYRIEGDSPNAHWYYLASCLGMYINWAIWTYAGIYIGTRFEGIGEWGLEFAMVVTFIGIVMPALRSSPYWLAAITAGLVAVLANDLPYKLGLMLGAVCGIVLGLGLQEWQRRAKTVEAE